MKRQAVPIIDSHVHLYPPEVNRDPLAWAVVHDEPHWAVLCGRRRKDGAAVQGFPSVDQLLRDMDTAGIAKVVLLGWYWEKHETCVAQNKFYADCLRAHPDRLAAFATVQPKAGTPAFEEACRAMDDGLSGFGELSPHSQHFRLDDPVWRQVLALAAEWKVPVNLHVTDPASRKYAGRVETPLADFIRLAQEFPATNFILAHWGGGLAWAREAAALPNVWFDTAASPLLYGPEVWAKAPHGRVLFGSDYPLILYPKTEVAPEFNGLLKEAKAAGASASLLGGNATKLFGW
ncbi:MAG: TatD family hydrolase [bacterium]|nr:TatD family hydrolase [bacterium]MDI1337846.1 TatD family hydrolase [Lacunisphaera sp.]